MPIYGKKDLKYFISGNEDPWLTDLFNGKVSLGLADFRVAKRQNTRYLVYQA